MAGRLGVGFIGSGFMTRFHIRSWEAVRDADIRGIYSPTRANAEDAAALARSLRVGDAKAFGSIEVDGRGRVDRLHLAVRPEFRARREHGAHRRRDQEGREAEGDRVREAARPQRRRSRAHGGAGRRGRRAARLSREPVVRAESRARQADRLGARRRGRRASVSRARGRRARRSAHAVVLAGRSAGRRRPERHDVPQPRGRPLPADQARRAARQHPAGQGVGADRVAEVVASGIRRSSCAAR